MSEDDFEQMMRQQGVKPLKPNDRIEPWRRKRTPQPRPQPVEQKAADEFADRPHQETPVFLDFRRPGVRKREYQDLQRGVIEPEASLDLHGLRTEEARRVLSIFLDRSLERGLRCVRIIHGKGRSSKQPPVLKQRLNQWLPQKPEVLAFCSAPRWDGGTGAVYVLLKRWHKF